jgi:glycosyltransferase involved in cell wall biosynthesis
VISILCPTYNEIDYITDLVYKLQNMPPVDKECIFIDGRSTDGTAEFLVQAEQKHKNLRLIDNPQRYVPFALNLGIKAAKGEVIIRIDSHTNYAEDYFTKILETFEEVEADIVGGPTRTAAKNRLQAAVGYAVSSPVGIGNSRVHQANYRGYSDSVTFGAWRRELFEDTGNFDEQLKRNQDDEFHYRARSLGKKIYQNPDIKLYYYPRDNLIGLFQQYFQYGLYKPLVLKKVRSEMKLRHLVPIFFLIYIVSLPFMVALIPFYWIPLALYFLALTLDVLRSGKIGPVFPELYIIYPTIHIAYGLGFLLGFRKL